VPITAVTLMLFSRRALGNELFFLLGWVVALAVISGVAYVAADQANAATDSTTSDTIAFRRQARPRPPATTHLDRVIWGQCVGSLGGGVALMRPGGLVERHRDVLSTIQLRRSR
jgi:hypothetical protein